MRDCWRGERKVKSKSTEYLPATTGHIMDGFPQQTTIGTSAYMAYRKRARFPGFTKEAIQKAIGMMHSQPPTITLPKGLENIRSSRGESLPMLLRRINLEQLLTGRVGVMADLPTFGGDIPYLSTYAAERIINWDDGEIEALVPQVMNLVVLDESESVREVGFDWTQKEKYRVLVLGSLEANEGQAVYRQGAFEEQFNEAGLMVPQWRGNTLNVIPFVIINSGDLVSSPEEPPLLDLANLCMTIYRSDADYRQNLFMQGQDTFVTTGANLEEGDAIRMGAGSRLDLPLNATAEYVGVTSQGLSEQRQAIERLEGRAGSMGAQIIDSTSRERESGDSLSIRVSARTADMNQIVDTSAAGLESILKVCAQWINEDPDEVSVKPNKEFGEAPLTGQTMVEIATAKNLGWPISQRSMHELSVRRRVTVRSYEEEQEEAKKETGSPFKLLEKDQNTQNNPKDNQTKKNTGNGPE